MNNIAAGERYRMLRQVRFVNTPTLSSNTPAAATQHTGQQGLRRPAGTTASEQVDRGRLNQRQNHTQIKAQLQARTLNLLVAVVAATGFGILSPSVHASQSLPQAGLIMHLDAGLGVQTRGSKRVGYWWDQSGYGQDLRGTGSPSLLQRELNGQPVILLNNARDKLSQNRSSSLPAFDNDRTLFVLSATNNTFAHIGYGSNRCGGSFGIDQDPEGYSSLASGCTANPMYADGQSNPDQWNLHVLMIRSGVYYQFRNGELVDGRNAKLSTDAGPFEILTPELQASDRGGLKVATVLAYNWALGTHEMRDVQRYIGDRWFRNANHFKAPPNLRNLRLPQPKMHLTQIVSDNRALNLSWRVSFADECGADTGWTRSRATADNVTIENPQRGASFALSCWHDSASASATFASEIQPLRITWQAPTTQEKDTTGYRLFLGTRSKRYRTIVQVPANPTNSHTLELPPGRYFVAMSTVGRGGRESSLSDEIAITVN